MPIDALIDELAEDLVSEMNDDIASESEVSEEVVGEKAADNSHALSDSEEPTEKSTVEIAPASGPLATSCASSAKALATVGAVGRESFTACSSRRTARSSRPR